MNSAFVRLDIRVKADLPQQSAQGTIAFLRNVFGPIDQVCTSNIDGKNLNRIDNPSGWILANPTLSPDGKQIAYIALTDSMFGRSKLFVMDVGGTNNRAVFDRTDAAAAWPSWAPDGSFILFTVQWATSPRLEVYSFDPVSGKVQARLQDSAASFSWRIALANNAWVALRSSPGNMAAHQSIVMGTSECLVHRLQPRSLRLGARLGSLLQRRWRAHHFFPPGAQPGLRASAGTTERHRFHRGRIDRSERTRPAAERGKVGTPGGTLNMEKETSRPIRSES